MGHVERPPVVKEVASFSGRKFRNINHLTPLSSTDVLTLLLIGQSPLEAQKQGIKNVVQMGGPSRVKSREYI